MTSRRAARKRRVVSYHRRYGAVIFPVGDQNPPYYALLNKVMPLERDERKREGVEGTILGRVYFVLDAEACQVKIGLTGNLQQRLKQLSVDRGRDVELLGYLKGGYDLERCLHARFEPYRREGREWYSTEILPDVLELVTREVS